MEMVVYKRSPKRLLMREVNRVKHRHTEHGKLKLDEFLAYIRTDDFKAPPPQWSPTMKEKWGHAVSVFLLEMESVMERTIYSMEEHYVVEKVLDMAIGIKRDDNGVARSEPCCKVRWVGYNDCTWVSVFDLQHNEAYHKYMQDVHRAKPSKFGALYINKILDYLLYMCFVHNGKAALGIHGLWATKAQLCLCHMWLNAEKCET